LQVSLKEVGESLSQAAQKFEQSDAGQRLKSEVQTIAQKVESGEVQTKVHNEMLSALQRATAELQKVTVRMTSEQPATTPMTDNPASSNPPQDDSQI
jgi:hypothetical protein